jgi:hypothetical protein
MPDERWWPIAEARLIFRHLVITIIVAGALYVATQVFSAFAPKWANIADFIDGWLTMSILVIMGLKLIRALIREDRIHVFATA